MTQEIRSEEWGEFIREFGERNRRRPTRLEVIGQTRDEAEDYWLEDGLPLSGVALETAGEGAPRVAIRLGGEGAKDSRHMTHTVRGVRRLASDPGGEDSGERLEIEDGGGAVTLLRL